MTTSEPVMTFTYEQLQIDYSNMGEEDLLATLLQIGQREGLWRHVATTEDNFYVIEAKGRRYQLSAAEVPGMIIGFVMATGRDLTLFAYRPGLARVNTPPVSVERAPHDQ